MDPCYFLGRREILEFINSVCGLNLSKVEQTCTGAVACQLLDAIHPGKVPMSKVDWTAKDQYQYVNNYKVLQSCFTKFHIDKPIMVDRLIRGRYQDNLEFMQWFKAFYDLNVSENDYDPISRRNRGKGGQEYNNKFQGSAAAGATGKRSVKTTSAATATTTPAVAPARTKTAPGRPSNSQDAKKIEQHELTIDELNDTIKSLTGDNTELRESVDGLEKERDFYFQKLRDVEVLLQKQEAEDNNTNSKDLVTQVLAILYEQEEDEQQEEGLVTAVEAAHEEDTEQNKADNVTPEDPILQASSKLA